MSEPAPSHSRFIFRKSRPPSPRQHRRGGRGDRLRMGSQAPLGRIPARGERGQAGHRPRGLRRGGQAYISTISDEGDRQRRAEPVHPVGALRRPGSGHRRPGPGMEARSGGRADPRRRKGRRRDVERILPVRREPGPAQDMGKHDALHLLDPGDEGVRFPRADHVGFCHVRLRQRRDDHRQVVAGFGHRVRRDPARHRSYPASPSTCGPSTIWVPVLDTPAFEGCRPFQEGSRGFVGGEAAVAMVLSNNPAGSYASILGGAMTMDGYHSSGHRPRHCRDVPLLPVGDEPMPGSMPDEVAYLNAHGPGTASAMPPK